MSVNNLSRSASTSNMLEESDIKDEDRDALMLKNQALTSAYAEAKMELREKQNIIDNYQKELFDTQSKYNNLRAIVKTIDNDVRRVCIPKLVEMVNIFTGILQATSHINSKVNTSTTQTVTPQIVNGTTLLTPTLTLTRCDEQQQQTQPNSQPISNVTQRQNSQTSAPVLQRMSLSMEDMNPEPGEAEPLVQSQGSTSTDRLHTIQEETEVVNQSSARKSRGSVFSGIFQDVKIYLNQLPSDQSRSNENISGTSSHNSTSASIYRKFPEKTMNNTTTQSTPNISNPDRNNSQESQLDQYSLWNSPQPIAMKEFGLSPTRSTLTTSTPIQIRRSRRNRPLGLSGDSVFITKERGKKSDRSPEDSGNMPKKRALRNSHSVEQNHGIPTGNKDSPDLFIKVIQENWKKSINMADNNQDSTQQSTSPSPKKEYKRIRHPDEVVAKESPRKRGRPARKVKPQSLKEPNCKRKMRR